MAEERHPTEIPLPSGSCFSCFLLHPPSFKKSLRAFADSAEEAPARGVTSDVARDGPPHRTGASGISLRGGRVSSFKWWFYFFNVFLILTISAHIQGKLSLKTKTHPEMYIWDSDQATEDAKPQVSCFMCSLPRGPGRALADGCTDLYIVSFLQNPLVCMRITAYTLARCFCR